MFFLRWTRENLSYCGTYQRLQHLEGDMKIKHFFPVKLNNIVMAAANTLIQRKSDGRMSLFCAGKVTLNTPTVLFFHEWTAHTRHWFYLTANLLIVQNKTRIKLYRVTFLCVSAEPDGSSVKRLSAWEPSRGFVRADTLPLCALHTQVWEAVCRRGSQLQRERGGRVTGARSASCRELWELRGGELGNLSPLPTHTYTDSRRTHRQMERRYAGR